MKAGSAEDVLVFVTGIDEDKKNGGPQKAPEMELVNGRWKPGAVKPTSIVLAPTRELAIQINDECSQVLPGGESKMRRSLRRSG